MSDLSETKRDSSDTISRQAAIDALEAHWDSIKEYHPTLDDTTAMYVDHKIIIKNLPSAQPDLDEWCDTCREYDQDRHCCPRYNRVIREAVTERKTGRWIACENKPWWSGGGYWKCSNCGYGFSFEAYLDADEWDYCPECGSIMTKGDSHENQKD